MESDMATNWDKVNKAARPARYALSPLQADCVSDDSIDVTCDLLVKLGIDPMGSDIADFENIRAELQTWVELALMGIGIYSDGSRI